MFRGSESSGKQPTTADDRAEYHDRCTFGLPSTMCAHGSNYIIWRRDGRCESRDVVRDFQYMII